VGKGGRCVGLTTLPPSCAVIMKCGNLNFLDPLGYSRPVTGLLYLYNSQFGCQRPLALTETLFLCQVSECHALISFALRDLPMPFGLLLFRVIIKPVKPLNIC
jgi:hypothetical protein